MTACRCLNCITPPHMLQKLLDSSNKEVREAALSTLLSSSRLRGQRSLRAMFGIGTSSSPTDGRRSIFDCRQSTSQSDAVLVRTEEGPPSNDDSVNNAFDGLGMTRDFFRDVLGRNSIDDRGMRLDGYVHVGVRYNNAFWDGQSMSFGDGDGILFTDFTKSLDVIAHELSHGVTEFTAGLEYRTQSGALNESISDVFGSLVKQWSRGQSAEEADWLIGDDIFTPGAQADALRSMKAPGTAYDNPDFGRDPQPAHMSRYVNLPDTPAGDNGGVHINSGIPNKAFYLTAVGIGGDAWGAPADIWYESLKASGPTTQFQEFADRTYETAGWLFGARSRERQCVQSAWHEVGIRISGASRMVRGRSLPAAQSEGADTDALASLTKQIETLTAEVALLTREMGLSKRKGDGTGQGAPMVPPAAMARGNRQRHP